MRNDPTADPLSLKALIVTLVGSFTAVVGDMTAQDLALYIGSFVGVVGVTVQIWNANRAEKERQARLKAMWREDKRAADRHAYEMERLRKGFTDSVRQRFEDECG